MQKTLADLLREIAARNPFFFPRPKALAAERWLRGRREHRRLRAADGVIVSRGKAGRTWFRIMLSRYYQVRYGLAEADVFAFDNLHRKNPAIPKLFFTHDTYLADYTGRADKADYRDRKVIFLARDPADTAVSTYFHWKHRMKRAKRIVWAGSDDDAMSVHEFVTGTGLGLSEIVDFMNLWAAELPRIERSMLLRYEDLRAEPAVWLERVIAFLGEPVDKEAIAEAVRFAAFDNMRKLEQGGALAEGSSRLVPGERGNTASYKTRRGKVGGYRDYFTEAECAEIDALIAARLSPDFGYHRRGAPDQAAAG